MPVLSEAQCESIRTSLAQPGRTKEGEDFKMFVHSFLDTVTALRERNAALREALERVVKWDGGKTLSPVEWGNILVNAKTVLLDGQD